jgi:hypothetical protein
MFAFTAVILLTVAADRIVRRSSAVAIVLAVLVALGAVASGFFTVRTGHLGAKAPWGHEEGGEGGGGPPPGDGDDG